MEQVAGFDEFTEGYIMLGIYMCLLDWSHCIFIFRGITVKYLETF